MTLATFWSSGRVQFRRECCQTDFRTTERHRDLTRLTHRSGISSQSTTTFRADGERARRLLETVETNLLIPIGLRSLAPNGSAYDPHYEGGVAQRDGSYHQGTVWPWLVGPFVEGWLRVRGNTSEAKAEARARFLPPLRDHLWEAGLHHVSEIVDAEPPHTPRGCPFQAWSIGEYLRVRSSL
jgi:glycogen debranching enzyme